MKCYENKQRILTYLVENSKQDEPQIVHAELLAGRLQIQLKDIRQLIKMMNEKGLVESDQEGDRVVVTRKGVSFWAEMQLSRAA